MKIQTNSSKPEKIFPVFQNHGLDAMVQAYQSNMRFFSYRCKQYLWQGLTGVRFLHFLKHINAGVQDLSHTKLTQSAWNVLNRLHYSLSVDWRIDMTEIKGRPVIFYARHPGYIEPMVCLAALKDFNPKTVSTAWVTNLSESVSQRIIPVPDSKEATRNDLRKYRGLHKIFETLWAHVLTFKVVKHLQGDMPAAECERQRRLTITALLSALSEKEPVLLFPSGGEGQKPWAGEHRRYFEKLMRIIISKLKRNPVLNRLHFVPLITRGSLRALFKSRVMMPWNPVTFIFRLLPDRPYKIMIREHVPLKQMLDQKMDSAEMVRYLTEKLVLTS
jgi:hypothetical protein